ncbi:hypothetical protein AB0L82_43100 [Nocardia sp. NPDC052001]|uniref:hypothetical protein n=1 Tax=Nocardia sp. NPDC052001 TaxID=3154853 RepID=UPI00342C662A
MTEPQIRRDAEAPGDLIRLAAGASLVRMNPRTLRRWIAQGKLTGWRMPSGHIHVDRDEVLRLAQPMQADSDDCEEVA